jgi:broad specificity phosphatase PhoE
MLLDEWLGGRHEESAANHAHELAKDGDHSLLHSIRHIQDRDFSLSEKGKRRAPHIGIWLERNGLLPFDLYMVSEYVRAHETTQLMNLRGATWVVDARLNERHWGADGQLSSHEREALRPDWKQQKEKAPYDWRPEGGETLREKMAAFAHYWRDINSHYPGKRCFAKCHGETLQAAQAVIEGLSQEQFARTEKHLRLGNGCMVHYKRSRGGVIHKRFIDPHRDTCTEWHPISAIAA